MAWIASRRARAVTARGQIGSIVIQLNQIFIDQPELRPYFIESGKLPKGQEQKAKALASMYLNILESIWSLRGALDANERLAWVKYIQHQIKTVPIVNDLYQRQKDWYPNINRVMEKTYADKHGYSPKKKY